MAFDGLMTQNIVTELIPVIINGKINKIFEPTKNEIIISIYNNKKHYSIFTSIASNNYRLHLTTSSKPNPFVAPNFCMLLRKHLIGGKIINIETFGLERIIKFKIQCYNEMNDLITKNLIIELMGKHSNVILTNEKDIIIDCLRHTDISTGSIRDIMPARQYILPPSSKLNFEEISLNDFLNIIPLDNNIINNIISNFTGISKSTILNIISTLNIDINNITKKDLLNIFNYLKHLLLNIKNTHTELIINNNDYNIISSSKESNLSINFCLDDFYNKKENTELFQNYRNTLLRIIYKNLKNFSKKLIIINDKLKECEKIDLYKLYGELTTANLYKFTSSKNLSEIVVENYYDNNNLIKIPLDNKINISKNANMFFKKYSKLKNTLNIVSKQKIEILKEIDYLESIIYELENCKDIIELKNIDEEIKEYLSKYSHRNYTKIITKQIKNKKPTQWDPIIFKINNYTIYVGKNNKQNDYISTKLSKANDIWFHTKDIHGSHVLLQTNNETNIPQEVILKCCQIAAYYSKAKLSSNVPVDYTFAKYVKKPSGSKPGIVIFTNNKTLYVTPEIKGLH